MASQRTTFNKLQRERAKKAKSAAKRERRQQRSDEAIAVDDTPAPDLTVPELLDRIERLHRRFDDGEVSFEDFEAQRAELYDQLSRLPMD